MNSAFGLLCFFYSYLCMSLWLFLFIFGLVIEYYMITLGAYVTQDQFDEVVQDVTEINTELDEVEADVDTLESDVDQVEAAEEAQT